MNHTDEDLVPGASPDASIMLRHILASLIAGVTTEVRQTDDSAEISVSVISMDTGLKFSFTLPSAAAVATSIQADIVMSDTSSNPAQNKVIKAYVDDKFWTGTAAEYALLEEDTDILCFLSDTNIIMYNGKSYSLSAHVHGNLTNAGAIGTLAGLIVMTGTDGVLETVTVDALKELLGASSGMNLLHNGEFASPFNTAGRTIYNTVAECLDRWSLLGGTLTVNAGHATLSQAAINTAQLRQVLPVGSYQRLMGQTLTLSVLLDDDEIVYQGSGVIDGAATTIMTVALTNGYSIRLVVNNVSKAAYVEVIGGASVAAVDLFRVKLEIGATASIEDGITDVALDWARVDKFALDGTVKVISYDFVKYTEQTLTAPQKAQGLTNIGGAALNHVSRHATGQPDALLPSAIGAAELEGGVVKASQARVLTQSKTASFTVGVTDAEKLTLCNSAGAMTVTLPVDAAIPIGAAFQFARWYSGDVTFVAGAGVGVTAYSGVNVLYGNGAPATAVKLDPTSWWLVCG